jgi:uncharacterized protein (DUF58 family)
VLRPLAVVRPAGWLALGVGGAGLGLGSAFDWTEVAVLALLLSGVSLLAVVFVLGRSTYAVSLDLPRLRVRVGEQAFGGLTLANTGSRAVLPALFVLPVGRGEAGFRVPRLAKGATHEEDFQVPTSRRAVIGLGPVRSSRGDPFGLMVREQVWTDRVDLFVHPKTVSLDGTSAGFLKDLEGRPTDDLSSSDIAFHALRDYVVGDDLRHIHWKTSARLGKLMVRQFEETRRSHLVVVLSLDPADYATPDGFELAVSVAASLGQQAIKEEKDVTVAACRHAFRTDSAPRLLDDFSRLDFGSPAEPADRTALAAAGGAPDASVAIVVTGGEIDPGRLNAALTRFPADVFRAAVRCVPGARLARRVLADAPVLTVGDLESFPRALRSLGV